MTLRRVSERWVVTAPDGCYTSTMKLSIIGLPQSGVTTVFNALTGWHVEPGAYAKPGHGGMATIKVPDRRLDALTAMYDREEPIHVSVEYLEVPGFLSATSGGATSDSEAAGTVRDSDACVKVLRKFDCAAAPNPRGPNDPLRDLRDINDELLTLDMAVIERRVERLRKDIKKPTPDLEQREIELAVLERCLEAVEQGKHLDEIALGSEEQKLVRGFRFLTLKPCIHVVNVNESDIGSEDALRGLPLEDSLAFCAKIEDEIGQLEQADRTEFLADLGIEESARDRLIRMSYRVLWLISFLTIGSDRVQAWTLKSGEAVLKAAETVHSDMARGFIRAEVMKFDDLEQLGSERELKAKGLVRTEGRDYVVQDGDIINIRFNV